MKEEFLKDLKGKQFVLYQGLLDEAHGKGLKGIQTQIVQVPTPDNGQVAVVGAKVEMDEGRTFTGIGDASPENVGRAIAPHIIRMAETRAKARALRDAINVGVTAFEELGPETEDEGHAPPTLSPVAPLNRAQGASRGSKPAATSNSTATPAMSKKIFAMAMKHADGQYDTVNKIQEQEGVKRFDELSMERANFWIEWLSQRVG